MKHLTTILFLHQKHHPEDGRITDQKHAGEDINKKIYHKIIVHLLAVYDCIYFIYCTYFILVDTVMKYRYELHPTWQ